jgi:hypothetical protein
MKKLTQTQILKLKKFITKKGELTNAGGLHEKISALFNGEVLRLNYTTGSGSKTRINQAYTVVDALTVAEIMGYKVVRGNDAPRGGRMGEFIKISRKINFSIEALNEQLKK